jgi:cyanuric acid amidohydrolase
MLTDSDSDSDSDLDSTRHARAAVGGLLEALKGDGTVYVSDGAEHQGSPGSGSVTVIYELPAG